MKDSNSSLSDESFNLHAEMEFLIHVSQISGSQMDLLRRIPFVPDNETPPENSSLLSSCGQGLDHCEVDQLNQRANDDSFAESSWGIRRDADDDELGVLERDFFSQPQDGICELLVKNSKLRMQKSGFQPSRSCLGVECQKVKERCGAESPCNVGIDIPSSNCTLVGEQVSGDNGISMLKNMDSLLEEEGQWKENCSDFDALKFLKENYESGDGLENAANELESVKSVEEDQKKKKISAFDVLKSLKEKQDSLENVCLLEDLMLCAITFPRPSWCLDNDFFSKQSLA